jgi:hypothetical protein
LIAREGVEMIGSRSRACAFLPAVTAAALALPTHAGPPFQTDDPGIVPRGQSEALIFHRQTLAEDGRSGVLPALELHHGATENLELDFVLPIGFHTPPGAGTRRGYGDTELGFKYGLIEETDTTPKIGFAPKLDLPTGNADRGLGNGGATLALPIWIHKTYGNLESYGGGGYWINRGADNRNYWFIGAVAEYRFAERWMLGAEAFHTTPQTAHQRASTGFNAGGSYSITANAQCLFAVGRGIRNAAETNRVSTYLGWQLSY